MKRFALLLGVVMVASIFVSCSRDTGVTPESPSATSQSLTTTINPETIANEIALRAGWLKTADREVVPAYGETSGPDLPGVVLSVDREVVLGDIAHYSFVIPVGPGPYDRIRLHRVVRESGPYAPVRTYKAAFLHHGDAVGFTKFMFGVDSPNAPDDRAFAVYLAGNGVDVWGIDQNWVLVPQNTADLSFMAGWGMQNQIDNLEIGLAVARRVRLATGNGWQKMILVGYSSGLFTTLAYLNQETQYPPGLRHVSGYVPIDAPFKTDFPPTQGLTCAQVPVLEAQIASGNYADTGGVLFQTLGGLARLDPDSPSPVIPGLTNLQAALLFGSATHQVFPYTPWYHYAAGTFDEFGLPAGLQFTEVDAWLDFLLSAASYEPVAFMLDYARLICDAEDVPFDDHLGEVTVPIFMVGLAGGLGDLTGYAISMTGSTDITEHLVRLYPPEAVALDFGHVDVWTAGNAETLVWAPTLDWINNTVPGRSDVARARDI